MKKLVIILGFFAVMMGFAIWEIVAVSSFYKETVSLLSEVEESFETYSDSLDSPDNIAVLSKLERHWDSGRNLILTFGNHTVIRNADERMTALGEFARQNEFSDAMVMLRQAQRYISDLRKDVFPSFTNLF